MAQFGSAPVLGTGGHRFESCYADGNHCRSLYVAIAISSSFVFLGAKLIRQNGSVLKRFKRSVLKTERGSDVLRGFESHRFLHALVVKLADTHDLGSCDASRESSNLSEGTKKEILQMNAVTEPSP